MLNILELVFNSQGLPDWYLTNKYPLLNRNGDVIGVFGTVRPYGEKHPAHSQELKRERMMKSVEPLAILERIFAPILRLLI